MQSVVQYIDVIIVILFFDVVGGEYLINFFCGGNFPRSVKRIFKFLFTSSNLQQPRLFWQQPKFLRNPLGQNTPSLSATTFNFTLEYMPFMSSSDINVTIGGRGGGATNSSVEPARKSLILLLMNFFGFPLGARIFCCRSEINFCCFCCGRLHIDRDLFFYPR